MPLKTAFTFHRAERRIPMELSLIHKMCIRDSCRSGKRSAEAVDFLRKAGFRKTLNLKGGILAWSDEVDPTVPKY